MGIMSALPLRKHLATHDKLATMRKLNSHAIAGSFPCVPLREQIGLAILNPNDERLSYQHEEAALFRPLRERLFRLVS